MLGLKKEKTSRMYTVEIHFLKEVAKYNMTTDHKHNENITQDRGSEISFQLTNLNLNHFKMVEDM
jgi:hypothetical protein